MERPVLRQIEGDRVEIRVPFRVPLNVTGQRRDIVIVAEIEGAPAGTPVKWRTVLPIQRGAMSAVGYLDVSGLGPCYVTARASVGGLLTEEAALYVGPMPGAVCGAALGADGVVRWLRAAEAVSEYRIYDVSGALLTVFDGARSSGTVVDPWRAASIAAVNVNGEGSRRELKGSVYNKM